MVNWLNYKLIVLSGMILLFGLTSSTLQKLTPSTTQSKREIQWGFHGHRLINQMAIYTLPEALLPFYKFHNHTISENAVNPDKRRYAIAGEQERHYIDIDHYYSYTPHPLDTLKHPWTIAVAIFQEDTLRKHGILPWTIEEYKYKLQNAFYAKNLEKIIQYSADIGHYIADAHVPLHTTKNYNGQFTNQQGIHGLWESRLVELYAGDYNFFVGKSSYISYLPNFIWDIVQDSFLKVDSVLSLEAELNREFPAHRKYAYEQRGNQQIQIYSQEYASEYHERLNSMVEKQMRKSILAIGSIWYTAWVDAGQPNLEKLASKKSNKRKLEQLNNEIIKDNQEIFERRDDN